MAGDAEDEKEGDAGARRGVQSGERRELEDDGKY